MGISYRFKIDSPSSWQAVWDTSINPVKPDFFMQENPDNSVSLIVSGPYVTGATGAGALLKGVTNELPAVPFSTLATNVTVLVDNSPARQWIEIDTRLTQSDGLTYPGDLDIGLDGTIRVGDITGSWHETAVKIPPFVPWTTAAVSILKSYDWTAKTSTVVSIQVGTQTFAINQTFPAANIGWTDSIVNQLQIDQTPQGGVTLANFSKISMTGD